MPKNTVLYRLLGLFLGALLLTSCSGKGALALRRPDLTPTTDRSLTTLPLPTSNSTTATTDPTQQAIQAAIQKANDEQAQAFAQHNPSLM
ncbi:MAG TPA: hypothetical protein VKX96_14780, partial [Chloroflexota bacterium]|nr:hypothetical protein [Chloroflexota bacterium]